MREELLRRRRARARQNEANPGEQDDKLRAQQHRDVTAALRRSTETLNAELGRSAEIGRVLDGDQASLHKTNQLQEEVGSKTSEAAQRLRAIQRKRRLEALMAASGMVWFALCALYVIVVRLLKIYPSRLAWPWLVLLAAVAAGAGWQVKQRFLR